MSQTSFATFAGCKAGFKFHSTDWNTSDNGVQLGASDGFELTPNGTPRTKTTLAENSAASTTGGRFAPVKSAEDFEGSLRANLGYASTIWRMIFGFLGQETTTILGSSANVGKHVGRPIVNSQACGALAWIDNLMCHDSPLTKIKSVEMDWQEGGIPSASLGVIGKKELVDGSGSNTISTMASVTLPTQPANGLPGERYIQLLRSTAVLRINSHTAAALAAADIIREFSGFNIKMERPYKMRRTARNLPFSDEPIVGAFANPTGSIAFPAVESTAYWARMVAGTPSKMDLTFTGSSIDGNFFWQLILEFPMVVFSTEGLHQLNNPDLAEFSLPFTAYEAYAAPSGMSGVVAPIQITKYDVFTINHLANAA